jgi:hypothetical protein
MTGFGLARRTAGRVTVPGMGGRGIARGWVERRGASTAWGRIAFMVTIGRDAWSDW